MPDKCLMIVDASYSLLAEIMEARNNIEEQTHSLNSRVEGVIGSQWVGSGADLYKNRFDQWYQKMKPMIQELDVLTNYLKNEIESNQAELPVYDSDPPPDLKNNQLVRNWWHNILRDHGKFSSYAILLVLPSDKEAIRYLKDYGRELDLISGKNCLVLTFGASGFRSPGFENELWVSTVEGHVNKGYSVNVAQLFDINLSDFPCLIVFDDIRSPRHIAITLKNLASEQIAEKLRFVFSTIQKAVDKTGNPVKFLDQVRKEEGFLNAGKSILSEVRSLAGKTIEMMFEAIINTNIK